MYNFFHPAVFGPVLRAGEKIWQVSRIPQWTIQAFHGLPHQDMIHVTADAKLANDLVIRLQARGDGLSDLVGKMNLRFVWLDENIKIQRFTV